MDKLVIAIKVFINNLFPEENRKNIIFITVKEWEKINEQEQFFQKENKNIE